jgi:nitrite reductase (NADH) large subunit
MTKLLIATGSDPFIIPVPGKDLPGVVTFRDLDDVDKMLERSQSRRQRGCDRRWPARAGGGAWPLAARDEGHRRPPDADADGAPARRSGGWLLLKTELERRGQTIVTGGDTAEIYGSGGHVEGVRSRTAANFPRASW